MEVDKMKEEDYRNSAIVKYIRKLNPEYNVESLHKLKNAVNKLVKLKKSSDIFRSVISEPEPETIIKSSGRNRVEKPKPYKMINLSSHIPSLQELVDEVMLSRLRNRKKMQEEGKL